VQNAPAFFWSRPCHISRQPSHQVYEPRPRSTGFYAGPPFYSSSSTNCSSKGRPSRTVATPAPSTTDREKHCRGGPTAASPPSSSTHRCAWACSSSRSWLPREAFSPLSQAWVSLLHGQHPGSSAWCRTESNPRHRTSESVHSTQIHNHRQPLTHSSSTKVSAPLSIRGLPCVHLRIWSRVAAELLQNCY